MLTQYRTVIQASEDLNPHPSPPQPPPNSKPSHVSHNPQSCVFHLIAYFVSLVVFPPKKLLPHGLMGAEERGVSGHAP